MSVLGWDDVVKPRDGDNHWLRQLNHETACTIYKQNAEHQVVSWQIINASVFKNFKCFLWSIILLYIFYDYKLVLEGFAIRFVLMSFCQILYRWIFSLLTTEFCGAESYKNPLLRKTIRETRMAPAKNRYPQNRELTRHCFDDGNALFISSTVVPGLDRQYYILNTAAKEAACV